MDNTEKQILLDMLNPHPNSVIRTSNARREAYRQAARIDITRGIPMHSTFGSFQQLTQVLPIQEDVIDLESINTKEPKYGNIKYGGVDD